MNPRGDRHCADAVREHDHVLESDAGLGGNVAHERVHIFRERGNVLGASALAFGSSMAASVERVDRNVIEPEQLDEFLPAAGMLVTAMEEQQRLTGRLFRIPRAIEQLQAVPGFHRVFGGDHGVVPVVRRRRAAPTRSVRCWFCRPRDARNCVARR